MAYGKDLQCFRYAFGIDTGYSFRNGTGYSIIETDTLKLVDCGLIRPFAPGLENHRATIDIAESMKRKWEEAVGFHFDPEILCIEYANSCFVKGGSRVSSNSIIMLSVLAARIEGKFKAKNIHRPSAQIWKGRQSKDDTKEMVLKNLDIWNKKKLDYLMSSIEKHVQHNVYDAIALTLWSINMSKNLKS